MTEKKDNSDRRKDATGLIYQTIKKLGLLTKRVEELEKIISQKFSVSNS